MKNINLIMSMIIALLLFAPPTKVEAEDAHIVNRVEALSPTHAGIGMYRDESQEKYKTGTTAAKPTTAKQPTTKVGMALIFLVITVLWLLLPVIPSLRELLKPTDTDPLTVVARDSADVSFFANNFRNYIVSQVEKYNFSFLRDFEPARLPDGTPFVRVQGIGKIPRRESSSANIVDHVIIAGNETVLPDDTTFLKEVYGVTSLRGGVNCVYRAILAEGELTLPPGGIVLRWVHSVGALNVQENTTLYGRASSDQALHLAPGVTFEWIAAPVISVGTAVEHIAAVDDKTQRIPFALDDKIKLTDGTYRYNQDLIIPDQSLIAGNLVVKGMLTIGPGSCIRGNLKSYEAVTLGNGCIVEGSIITRSTITIGDNCILWGPIISEREIITGNGSAIGTQDKPATVSAPLVTFHPGVVVIGMVVAKSTGKTIL